MDTSINYRVSHCDNEILSDPARKFRYNKILFRSIAPVYDNITRILSLGKDQKWKKMMISWLPNECSGVVLDIACGTGDLAEALSARYGSAKVLGADMTMDMVKTAVIKAAGRSNMFYTCQNMNSLSFRDKSVSVITGGYALRNSPDLYSFIAEINRVIIPGGVVAFLDFSRYPGRFTGIIQYGILFLWGALWGIIFHGNHRVYSYISKSLKTFPVPEKLDAMFEKSGFTIFKSRYLFLGTVRIFMARKNSPGKD